MATRMLPKTHLDAQDFSRFQINLEPFKLFTPNLQVHWFKLAKLFKLFSSFKDRSYGQGGPESSGFIEIFVNEYRGVSLDPSFYVAPTVDVNASYGLNRPVGAFSHPRVTSGPLTLTNGIGPFKNSGRPFFGLHSKC
ncbi:hypothetical protein K438DRAFT_1765737 [Mycena galopus ATCC 62051]|nr:hypothetical protein K438DRAFT_1765737 [Mycena galopus ATCC 62051]